MNLRKLLIASVLLPFAVCPAALAGATADEAAKLKTTLTPLGGERAGNADGSIPAWDGGYNKVAPGYKPGDIRPDPFPGEKPLFSITAQNMASYADKLTDGDKALLEKYPSYRIEVYPTHRTASAPQWVYDNTFKNATSAKTTHDGDSVEGAYGGIPFPIPKTGKEVMWNHLLHWEGQAAFYEFYVKLVTADGKQVEATKANQWIQYPYYKKDGEATWNGDYWWLKQIATSPSFKAGEAILLHDSTNFAEQGRQSWQYLTGQRRVRKAPTIGYDTPDFVGSGIANFDEAFMFMGGLDRYDWKVLGKKEVYVPYNNNRFSQASFDQIMGEHHLNPDFVRYELHRVWVVEATLAEGKRNVVAKRRYYVDEDSWLSLGGDGWDASGKLWKHYAGLTLLCPDLPGLINSMQWVIYNFQMGAYNLSNAENGVAVQYKPIDPLPAEAFSPEALAGENVR